MLILFKNNQNGRKLNHTSNYTNKIEKTALNSWLDIYHRKKKKIKITAMHDICHLMRICQTSSPHKCKEKYCPSTTQCSATEK